MDRVETERSSASLAGVHIGVGIAIGVGLVGAIWLTTTKYNGYQDRLKTDADNKKNNKCRAFADFMGSINAHSMAHARSFDYCKKKNE
jgi:hypothetical protein